MQQGIRFYVLRCQLQFEKFLQEKEGVHSLAAFGEQKEFQRARKEDEDALQLEHWRGKKLFLVLAQILIEVLDWIELEYS
jgi:hypothetical protein